MSDKEVKLNKIATTGGKVNHKANSLLEMLREAAERGAIRLLDYQFARFICSMEGDSPYGQQVGFLAGLVSAELAKGHICIDIANLNIAASLNLYGEAAKALDSIVTSQRIGNETWYTVLQAATTVGKGGDTLPLVLDNQRLYLQKYWYYQQVLAEKLAYMATANPLSQTQMESLSAGLDNLFPQQASFIGDIYEKTPINWQKVAVAVALTRKLTVISGGPGTGKTTTVVKLLAAILSQGLSEDTTPNIKLVAPTGKAATRLTESVNGAAAKLNLPEDIFQALPREASTIHRLLGAIPNRTEFRYNQFNPLHLDLLVVDEASMVDLPLMVKLLSALPKQARLILLGDKDQLASVEAGAILGDICSFNRLGYSAEQSQVLEKLTGFTQLGDPASLPQSRVGAEGGHPIADSLCMLKQSYRFDANSGIGRLATAINKGSRDQVSAICQQPSLYSDINIASNSQDGLQQMIELLVENYRLYIDSLYKVTSGQVLTETVAKIALDLFAQCRLLCALREGEFGVVGLNRRIEQAMTAKGLVKANDEPWYIGRPVMVTRNDHALGLYNGDIGICMLVDDESGGRRLKVFFELADGSIKGVLPSRVPQHETAYAMTIHKSQGSEFNTTVILLPEAFSPILTRELIYTGVTRAKQQLHLYTQLDILQQAVSVKTERRSGLKEVLYQSR